MQTCLNRSRSAVLSMLALAAMASATLPSHAVDVDAAKRACWNQVGGNEGNQWFSRGSKIDPAIQLAWRTGNLNPLNGTHVAFQGKVYVPQSLGGLAALDKQGGAVAWTFQASGEQFDTSVACETRRRGTLIYIVSTKQDHTGVAYCLRDEGPSVTQVWRRPLALTPGSSIALSKGRLYFKYFIWGGGQGVLCLNASDGSTFFDFSDVQYALSSGKPAVNPRDGRIYVSALDRLRGEGVVLCLDAYGNLVSRIPMPLFYDPPGTVILESATNRFYVFTGPSFGYLRLLCYDGASGTLLWNSETYNLLFGYGIQDGPYLSISNGLIYAGLALRGDGIYALDTASGSIVWHASLPEGDGYPHALTTGDGRLWLTRTNWGAGSYACYDAFTGGLLNSGSLPFLAGGKLCADEDSLYTTSGNSVVRLSNP